MSPERRDPLILDLSETPLPPAPAPADAPPPPDAAGSAAAERALRGVAGARVSMLGRIFWAALTGLVGLWLVTSIEAFVTGLFARSDALGWAAAGLAGLLALAIAGYAIRELAGLARIRRIGEIHRLAALAADDGGAAEGKSVTEALARLYRGRPEMAEPLARVDAARAETPDAPALMAVAERTLLAPLDKRAERAVARAAARVAAVTAVVPLPLIDVLAVLGANLAMIREVAEIYGGRAGTLGSWRLLRAVAAHLVTTGAVAATDDLLGPMVGGGVLGRLSRRFGEAAVNAALTARVGTAAIEVCRPLPFAARPAPRAAGIVLDALKGWRNREDGATPQGR